MKKTWSKPVCSTLSAPALAASIRAAAYSGEGVCEIGDFR